MLMGALMECAKQVSAMTTVARRDLQEEITLAYVRGAMRGEDGPLNEDGSHYGDW